MSAYVDTSLLVSSYLQDSHSQEASQFLSSGNPISVTALHLAEWAHAIAQHVYRGLISLSEAERLTLEFQADRIAGVWLEVSVPENALAACAELARIHGPKLGMRTLDTLHVACALELKAERFWTFDERQKKLAKAAGLKTT